MEFEWTTFALEVLNFLVLVWLLKHFFYRPVLAVIEARRAETAKILSDAEAVRCEAEGLKSDYLARLAEAEQDRAAAKAKLDEEIAAEQVLRLADLDVKISGERKRREAVEARERAELVQALERQALSSACRFATRLLERLAGPELDAKLADFALGELAALPPDKSAALVQAMQEPEVSIKVLSAFPLDEARCAAFTQILGQLAGRPLTLEFGVDATLKAGVCIMAGSWVLMADLRDELGFFTGTLNHG